MIVNNGMADYGDDGTVDMATAASMVPASEVPSRAVWFLFGVGSTFVFPILLDLLGAGTKHVIKRHLLY